MNVDTAQLATWLRYRSSRPLSLLSQTAPATCAAVEALRRQRYPGSRVLRRLGLNRVAAQPVRRYEREHPGEIIRFDIKKLGRFEQIGHRITGDCKGQSNSRGVGWEYQHHAIDDPSRLACSEILPDEKRGSSLRFLFNALRFFRAHGVKVQRVMTDNDGSFRSCRYAKALRL